MKPSQQLASAAAKGDLKTMRALLKKDQTLAEEWKPMMDASLSGQAEAVALLLEKGANANVRAKNAYQYRPLHRTVEHKKTMPKHQGHHKVVDLLLDAGADPLMKGSSHKISAIAVCATGDSTEFLPALLERTPRPLDIFHASLLGELERVRELLREDPDLATAHDPDTRIYYSEKGWTPMHYCAKSCIGRSDTRKAQDLAETAQLLLLGGADPHGCVDLAVYAGNLAVLEILLKAGGEIADDDTLNHSACEGLFESLEMLLKYKVPLDGTKGTGHHGGYTPLGCAVSCRSLRGAQWFLDHGQDPNEIKSADGENALHVAVHWGASDKMLRLLLDYGAKLEQKDKQGRTPLARAREKNRKKAIAFLEVAGSAANS